MNCMKCGRDITEGNVFCQDCLVEMEKYPVEPGTVVLLPRRKENPSQKRTVKRHTSSPEEQLVTLRRRNRILFLMLLGCIVAICFMFRPTMHYVLDEHVPIGQNYSTVAPAPTNAD